MERGGDEIGRAGRERRYYYRLSDLDNAGWRTIRRLADGPRRRVHHLFRTEVFDDLLPPPDAYVALKDGIIDTSGLKALLRFLLGSKSRL